jgi:SAM-dependent methyltransferase
VTSRDSAEKQHAIAIHSEQSQEFQESYRSLAEDPYKNCFAYSRHRLEAALRRFLPSPAQGRRLLDIGCGTGHHLAGLRAQGFEVSGMDGSASMLEHARRNNPEIELKLGDVEQLPFESGGFDVALCVEVLRYLRSPDACLREAHRVLRAGGILVATAAPLFNVNGYFVVNRLVQLLPTRSFVRLRQFFLTSGRLRHALGRAGFADVEIHGVYTGPINWLERLAPRSLPRALKRWERFDERLADRPMLREFSNMFLVRARRA